MNGPEEAPTMRFEILRAVLGEGTSARLGRLSFRGRQDMIASPNFFAISSRGVVPHLTPDNISQHCAVTGVYMALEDFVERNVGQPRTSPPIFQTPAPTSQQSKRLHTFTATPASVVTVLGARRLPAVATAVGNTQDGMAIFTSRGYQALKLHEYHAAVASLQPDVAIPLADLTYSSAKVQSKRAVRMADRTDDWLRAWFEDQEHDHLRQTATFAPVLPISHARQREYLDRLSEEYAPTGAVAGLSIYDVDVLPDLLAAQAGLASLPRLSLDDPAGPHEVLRQVSLGVDVFMLPFVNRASDSGVALTWSFPPAEPDGTGHLGLGVDLAHIAHQTSFMPLQPGCACYTCRHHHRAYVHHLLRAREMLGWTLLQLHNHFVANAFFAGMRATLSGHGGGASFEAARRRFAALYEPEIPVGAGERPRARGYQFNSEFKAPKRNKPAWGKIGAETTLELGQDTHEIGVVEGT